MRSHGKERVLNLIVVAPFLAKTGSRSFRTTPLANRLAVNYLLSISTRMLQVTNQALIWLMVERRGKWAFRCKGGRALAMH